MGDSNLAQAFNYLEAYKMEVGLLINFGARSLQWKRVHKHYDIYSSCEKIIKLIPTTIRMIQVLTGKEIKQQIRPRFAYLND